MASIVFTPMLTEQARRLQAGWPDAYGRVPERHMAGADVPCRHCLQKVPKGKTYLLAAHRPFSIAQPYAETGPIFVCADTCERAVESADLPACLTSERYMLRGYDMAERIVPGTGGIVEIRDLLHKAEALLADAQVAFLHVRSESHGCFQCRIDGQNFAV